MRINPDNTINLLSMLSLAQQQEQESLQQLSSGRRIHNPSDDPAGSAALSINLQSQSQQDQFLQSIASVRELLSTSDSTLNSIVQSLERAVSLGIEGATGTQSAENRSALAEEVQGIREQVLTLANTSFRGVFLFAGTEITTQPFVDDPSASSGIAYNGNQKNNAVLIEEGRTMPTGLSGDKLFCNSSANVFASLKNLISALNANDPTAIAAASTEVRNALTHVTNSRVMYGNGLNQLDTAEEFLNQLKLQLQTREDTLSAADPAEAISRLRQAQFARDATLAAAAKTQFTSLLDYLQ